MSLVVKAATLVAFPVAASAIGAVVAAVRPPGQRIVSGVQHFAAGVVMAALVGEIMPELRAEGHLVWTVVGFVAGAALVLALGAYGRHTEEENAEAARKGSLRRQAVTAAAAATLPIGMLGAMAVDLLLDGVLVGLGVRLGSTQGLILTVALTLEGALPGAVRCLRTHRVGGNAPEGDPRLHAARLDDGGRGGRGRALPRSASTTVMSAVLAFGAAALLYLVVEELLVEAHEEKESVVLGSMFFLGFLVVYVLAALGE